MDTEVMTCMVPVVQNLRSSDQERGKQHVAPTPELLVVTLVLFTSPFPPQKLHYAWPQIHVQVFSYLSLLSIELVVLGPFW